MEPGILTQHDEEAAAAIQRFEELSFEDQQKITHVARVCIALEQDEQLQQGSKESPSVISERLSEVTGLEPEDVTRAIAKTINEETDQFRYFERATDESGYKLAVTEAGRHLITKEVKLAVGDNI